MPIIIRVEDSEEKVIEEIFDQKGMLNYILNKCYDNKIITKTFKYIDLYDDTIFNSLQVQDLLDDIKLIKSDIKNIDNERRSLLNQIEKLSLVSLQKPHQYLKFYGD